MRLGAPRLLEVRVGLLGRNVPRKIVEFSVRPNLYPVFLSRLRAFVQKEDVVTGLLIHQDRQGTLSIC